MMNTKAIVIGVVAIIIVLAGIYVVFRPHAAAQPTGQQAGQQTDKVQGKDITVGTGDEATAGTVVSVLYEGRLQDGTVFDSSAAHGNQPLKFQLGAQGLIPGFQIGVNGMKVGGEREIVIPPSLGYGAQDVKDGTGKVVIPQNSTITFDVKLVAVETLAQAQAEQQAATNTSTTTAPTKAPVKPTSAKKPATK